MKSSKSADFFALREIKVIGRTVGTLIPDFKDQRGLTVSIDRLVNRLFPTTGLMCALDVEKLDLIDLTEGAFTDQDVHTHRVDIVGQGYDDLNLDDVYAADDGGFNPDTTAADFTPLIDVLSYSSPADSELIFKITDADSETNFNAGTINSNPVAIGDLYEINPLVGDTYLAAMQGSTLYKAYIKGFLRNGDIVTDGSLNYYVKVIDTLTNGIIPYIKFVTYQDISLINQDNINSYVVSGDTYIKVILENGADFKHTFDLTTDFLDYTILQPNKLILGINSVNKALVDEFLKVNQYIKAKTTSGRIRLVKIISITSTTGLSPATLEYTITTMVPSTDEVIGLDTTGDTLQVYKGIYNFVPTLKGQYVRGFKIKDTSLPNGTGDRQSSILSYLFTDTSIPQTLANGEVVDFRYVVDTYEGEISNNSKYYLSKLAAMNGQAMAILNSPSIQQFERSVDPSFIDTTNKLVSARLIAAGGDLALNPSQLFKFAEEDVNGVPLSSYSMFNFPNFIVRSGSKNISVPPAGYISNLYVRKFKNGTPFLIVAGGKRGAINDIDVVGLEYDLTDDDRNFLEPIGHNLIVKRRGFGILLFSNNTAYQRINSALNNAHVRDNLSTIENDIEKILFNFLFDFNDEITRMRVKTIVQNYLDAVVSARGLSSYTITFDSSNNTNEVISANTAIIDIKVDFPRGIHKFINRITITRVGGSLSSESTGFIPSF